MNQRQAPALVGDGILDCRADEALRALLGDGLDADARGVGEADLGVGLRKVLLEELEEFAVLLGAGLELDADVDVLRILAEDHHVDLLRVLHGGGHALEPTHRPETDVQVEELAQCNVERADPAADRRREGSLDRDQVVAAGRDCLIRQPGVELPVGLLAGEDLHPVDLALAAVGLGYRGVHDAHAGAPDVRPGAVALDERDDRIVGDDQLAVPNRNLRALRGRRDLHRCSRGHDLLLGIAPGAGVRCQAFEC